MCDSPDTRLPWERTQPELGCKADEVLPSVLLLQHLHPCHSPFPGCTALKTSLGIIFSVRFLQGCFCAPSSVSFPPFPHVPLCSFISPLSISIFLSPPSLSPAHILPRTPAILGHRHSLSLLRNLESSLLSSRHLGGVHLHVATTVGLTLGSKFPNTL